MKSPCMIGAQVALTSNHWLRPYERGTIVDQQRQAVKKWLVQFEDAYQGGGIGGDKLWCDEGDFAEVTTARPRRADAEKYSISDGPLLNVVPDGGNGKHLPA